jgi:hypothetical protein
MILAQTIALASSVGWFGNTTTLGKRHPILSPRVLHCLPQYEANP